MTFHDAALKPDQAVNRRKQERTRLSTIRRRLLRWYHRSGRDLPWRRTREPYRVLISEVMLQQTQVSRVLTQYPRWLKRFPAITVLARARRSTVIRAWRGMGYNARAVRLHGLAKAVVRNHNGRLPRHTAALQHLPGIGRYTAHAVACFAFGQSVAVVDTNVRRVLSRLFPRETKRKDIWAVASGILPKQRAYDWNQVLFDLGSTVCTARTPQCTVCSLEAHCPSAHNVAVRVLQSKREPMRPPLADIPNRIYRGRVVEALRDAPRGSLSAQRLGKLVKPDYTRRNQMWFLQLLRSLERDGLVTLSNGSAHLTVSLAR